MLVGLQHDPVEINFRDVSVREIELLGTQAHCVGADLPEALRLLSMRPGGWSDIAPVALSLDHLVVPMKGVHEPGPVAGVDRGTGEAVVLEVEGPRGRER